VQRSVASLAVLTFVASCSLALYLSWDVFSEPRLARAQTTGTCPNAQFIDTFTGNGDQQTDTFNTTTNSFRVSYNVTGSDPQFPSSLYIDVIDANDPDQLPVGDATHDGDGQGETFVNSPAGTYFLDISFYGEGNYTITVEQCEGGNPSRGTPDASASPVASSPPSSAPVSAPASDPATAPTSTPPGDSGSAPDSAPASESILEGQNAPGPDSECPGARVVNTTSGNGDKQSPVFNISGESFRVTTTLETNTPQTFAFGAIVNKEGGGYVTTIGRESPGRDSSIVNAGPGRFFLDITSAYTNYVVTVEDCPGASPGGPPERRPSPVDRPEGVIERTPVREVPFTGGPPYLAVGGVVLLGAALIAGRGALRR
jgi:hypothetical protein